MEENKKNKIEVPIEILSNGCKYGCMFIAIFAMLITLFYIIAPSLIDKIYKRYEIRNELYKENIEVLDEMSKNINGILLFISVQKQKLIDEQEDFSKLKIERESLKLLAESDKKIVETLFLEQEKRQRKNIFYERTISFIIGMVGGIISSLIASIIYKKMVRKEKNKTIEEV